METSGWVSVRCLFRVVDHGDQLYEERITLWHTANMDTAIERAEAEAREYAEAVDVEYVGLAQAFLLFDRLEDGAEVFSLVRGSQLDPEDYIDRHFDTGAERQRQWAQPAPPGDG